MNIQKQYFPDGGFVIHRIQGKFKGRASAWYNKDGIIIDCEQIINNVERKIKPNGPIWNELAYYGLPHKNNADIVVYATYYQGQGCIHYGDKAAQKNITKSGVYSIEELKKECYNAPIFNLEDNFETYCLINKQFEAFGAIFSVYAKRDEYSKHFKPVN